MAVADTSGGTVRARAPRSLIVIWLKARGCATNHGFCDGARFFNGSPAPLAHWWLIWRRRRMPMWKWGIGLGFGVLRPALRNLLKCARAVGGRARRPIPRDQRPLLQLPGIGPYTRCGVISIAFDRRSRVLDGQCERVMARLYEYSHAMRRRKPGSMERAEVLTPAIRPGRNYAQAVMGSGATICTPKSPTVRAFARGAIACLARRNGTEHEVPKKTRKKAETDPAMVPFYLGQRATGHGLA